MAIDLNQISGHVAQRYLVDIDLAGNCLRNAVLNNVRVQTSSAVLSSTSVTVGGDDVGEIWFYNGRLYYGAEEGKPWVRIATGDIGEELDKIFGMVAGDGTNITASYDSDANKLTISLVNSPTVTGTVTAGSFNKVTITPATTTNNSSFSLGYTNGEKTSSLSIPSGKAYTIGDASQKGVDSSVASGSTSTNLPTTSAVASYAQHQVGYAAGGTDSVTSPYAGDVVFVPDDHEDRLTTLEDSVFGDTGNPSANSLSNRVEALEGNVGTKVTGDTSAGTLFSRMKSLEDEVGTSGSSTGSISSRVSSLEGMYALISSGTTVTADKGKTYGVAGSGDGTTNYCSARWIINLANGETSLRHGMMINIIAPVAGHAGGTVISINGNVDNNFRAVVRDVSSAVTSRYGANTVLTLVYDEVTSSGIRFYKSAGSYTTPTGRWIVVNDKDDNTKNSAGATAYTKAPLYIIGAPSVSTNPQTYTNKCYIDASGNLHSGAAYQAIDTTKDSAELQAQKAAANDASTVITKATYNADIASIRTELATVYQVKGSLNSAPLPVPGAVGDVWNINIGDTGLDIEDIKTSFIDPPTTKYLPNGTNIVCVELVKDGDGKITEGKWDIMGGTSASSYRVVITGNGSTPSFTEHHNLGVIPNVQVFDSTGARVITAISATTSNVTIAFNTAPAANVKYTVVCTL